MDKKNYTAPMVNKVSLEVKNAVLGFCHSSPNMFPNDELGVCGAQPGSMGNPCPQTTP